MNWKYLATDPPAEDDTLYMVAVHNDKGKTRVLDSYYKGRVLRRITRLWAWTFYAYAIVEPVEPPPLP